MSNKENKNNNNNFFNQNPLITFAIFSVVIILLFKVVVGDEAGQSPIGTSKKVKQISYSELKSLVETKSVNKVEIGQSYIKAVSNDGSQVYTTRVVRGDTKLIEELDKQGIEYQGFSESNWFTEMFGWLFPFLIIIAIWMFFAGRMQKSMGGGMLGMGQSKKMINSEKPKTKFDDVAGVEEAKEEVQEIVDFLKYPGRYVEIGAKIPKGVLLVGSPGTGKTLLAKAVAGEAEVPFFSVSGSSFIEMFVGVGAARVKILKVHMKNVKMDSDVEIEEVARLTAGLAGADLANVVNEAALLAGRKSQKTVKQKDLFESVERAIAGLAKKSRRINPKEKKIVAYHESGHALLAETTVGAKSVSKVSIVPRGLAALGYTLNKPEEDKFMMQRHELWAEVDVLLGGRAAEQVFIGEISTGAGNDLERATDIIKSMVQTYGMSDIAGLMVLEKSRQSFLGQGQQASREYSDKMAQDMDEFIKVSLQEHYENVVSRLEEYRGAIESMVALLYKKENITGEEVRELILTFEKENNLESKVVMQTEGIEDELKDDANMTDTDHGSDDEK
jgi:ATP-dependent Zn protease